MTAAEVLAWLENRGTKAVRDGMARYGNQTSKAYGVPMGVMQQLAKRIGKNHALALELWDTGWYEARMVASLIDDPEKVTAAQMERWCRDFDNWGLCDTVCFFLFDRTPHAFQKVKLWAKRKEEYQKRAAFALLACVALHDKNASEAELANCLPLIESGASDDRNFVKKAVVWALRGIGERSPTLNAASIELARKLVASDSPAARWVGKDALKGLTSPATKKRLASRKS